MHFLRKQGQSTIVGRKETKGKEMHAFCDLLGFANVINETQPHPLVILVPFENTHIP